ncbi:hypothetical protein [Chryseobacterium sp. 2R14A]|uniref:hypothetical protein n=1 Tax=Chryseobacterium sp. 2R14A TaxID=3380353 RepID=UPI003CEA279A
MGKPEWSLTLDLNSVLQLVDMHRSMLILVLAQPLMLAQLLLHLGIHLTKLKLVDVSQAFPEFVIPLKFGVLLFKQFQQHRVITLLS